jgi:hypothetical protein
MPCDGGPKLHLPTLAIVALGLLLPGCGGARDTAKAKDAPVPGETAKQSVSSRVTVHSGGLAITLTATPTRAKIGSTVQFEVTASEAHALGALGYQLRYGDGTSAENVVPQFCVAGRGAASRQTWHLSHRYKAAGRYRVSASVYVDCTSDHATATVAVDVT